MRTMTIAVIVAALMGVAAAAGVAGKPTVKRDTSAPAFMLEAAIPAAFGEWQEQRQDVQQVVNPQTKEILDKLYSQQLSRVYVNKAGQRIMLSLAYGDDQRGSLQAHMPETCYPAQGFKLHDKKKQDVATPYGAVPATRLATSLGPRLEPVTYWFTLGDQTLASSSRWQKRLIEFRFGLTGEVPDGLLFRVSSIDGDSDRAYALHDRFIQDLLARVEPLDRARLLGRRG
jgi:EpsI family protein